MDTFILHAKRQSALSAMASSTDIIINGTKMGRISNGGSQDIVLERRTTQVHLLTSVPLGKDIETTVTIDPRDSAEVTLLFTYKINAKMFIPFGAFTQAQARIETEVIYGPSSGSPYAKQAAFRPQASSSYQKEPGTPSPQAPKGKQKFCTECGFKNDASAKFCMQCGHPF